MGYCGTINGEDFCYDRREEPGLSAKHTPSHQILLQEEGVYQKASIFRQLASLHLKQTYKKHIWPGLGWHFHTLGSGVQPSNH